MYIFNNSLWRYCINIHHYSIIIIPNLYSANFKQMLRSAQLCYRKDIISTFHINDLSNNNEIITLWSSKNNKQESIITLTELHTEDIWIHIINISIF